MTKNSPRNPDDEVESLAHDLLGVDLNATDDEDDPLEVDGLGLDDLGFGLPDPPPAEPTSATDEAQDILLNKSAPASEDDDPVAWLVSAAKNAPPAVKLPFPDDDDDDDDGIDDGFGAGLPDVDDDGEPQATVKQSPQADPKRDAYWDALDDLDFGTNEEKKSRPREDARKSRPSTKRSKGRPSAKSDSEVDSEVTEKPKTRRPPQRRVKSKRAEQSPLVEDEDDGFGTGILDDAAKSARKMIEDDFEADEIVADEDVTVEEAETDDDFDDDFGAGIVEPAAESRPKRRRGPRQKRVQRDVVPGENTRAAAEKPPRAKKPVAKSEAAATREVKAEKKDRYANIPTWEEAISSLDLKPQKKSDKRYSSQKPAEKSGDGRGNRRRGRGRKPKE